MASYISFFSLCSNHQFLQHSVIHVTHKLRGNFWHFPFLLSNLSLIPVFSTSLKCPFSEWWLPAFYALGTILWSGDTTGFAFIKPANKQVWNIFCILPLPFYPLSSCFHGPGLMMCCANADLLNSILHMGLPDWSSWNTKTIMPFFCSKACNGSPFSTVKQPVIVGKILCQESAVGCGFQTWLCLKCTVWLGISFWSLFLYQ